MDAPPKIIGTTFDAFRGADGAVTDVPIQPLIVLRFDRVLAPSSVSRANYRLSSGPVANVEFLEPRVDPVERTVVLRLQVPLATGTRYDLHVRGSPDVTTQLAAFDGARFEGEAVFSFTTFESP